LVQTIHANLKSCLETIYAGLFFLRNLQDAKNSVTIDKQKIKVEAKIETIFGYSSHKDSDHLVEFVSHGKATLKKVFPVMGEPKSSLFLAQRIKDELGIDAMYPEKGKRYEL
jgi:metallo-beta-lactamase family protein